MHGWRRQTHADAMINGSFCGRKRHQASIPANLGNHVGSYVGRDLKV